ncbi:MAG: Hpt domain-containing protein [Alphaproteobacteria bacterium]|nr:Hpt domain-containing protein [Alphaproteobacteria bacterium]
MMSAGLVAEIELPERAGEAEPAILDLAHLRRYTLDDMPLQREILGLFRDQVLETVAKLRASCDDKPAWAMAAHTLKGSARCVGAFRLGRAAERAERNSQTAEARAWSAEQVAEAAIVTLAHLR